MQFTDENFHLKTFYCVRSVWRKTRIRQVILWGTKLNNWNASQKTISSKLSNSQRANIRMLKTLRLLILWFLSYINVFLIHPDKPNNNVRLREAHFYSISITFFSWCWAILAFLKEIKEWFQISINWCFMCCTIGIFQVKEHICSNK